MIPAPGPEARFPSRTARRALAVCAAAFAAGACAVPAAHATGGGAARAAVGTLGEFVSPEAVDARSEDGSLTVDAPFLQRG
ncbi:hypothetical protein [Streptomyces sp. NPDC005805]|uniref:hypothetical protein n=1 Tax=Streptomyces sp. NPDC005805 TaxID=3157068 RepID=UPI0034017652